jgi:hypothetical protein
MKKNKALPRKKDKRGGARKGAGKKKMDPAKKVMGVTMHLPNEVIDEVGYTEAKRIGSDAVLADFELRKAAKAKEPSGLENNSDADFFYSDKPVDNWDLPGNGIPKDFRDH